MRWRKQWYALHRWIGLVVSLQLLAWSVGGLVFSLLDIENVRGNRDRASTALPLRTEQIKTTSAQALEAAAASGIDTTAVIRLSLRERGGQTVFELIDDKNHPLAMVDASSGHVVKRINKDQVIAAALADFTPKATVESVSFLEGEAPSEFRGGQMPVYRVVLDHPKHPHLYISPVTGEVLKRRNEYWRWFDFFWMLHIMDYRNRDDFNHWLLTGMSALAILTSASGLGLWWWRIPRRRRLTWKRSLTG